MTDTTETEEAAIRATLRSYNDALNGGVTAAVLTLYAEDGIFMAPFSPSFIGIDAIRSAYDAVFRELAFDVVFTIHEVVPLSADHAYVRTNSMGRTRHTSTGQATSEANQELFIMRRTGGRWLIARYSFSPTQPPGAE